jgi:hypothetical protein
MMTARTIAYRASTSPHAVGATFSRPRGFTVATTIDAACAGAGWPLRVHEVEVALDAMESDGGALRVQSYRALREVAPEETFGPRAVDLVALVDGLPGARWLRPDSTLDVRWIEERVRLHLTGSPDPAPPLLILRDVAEIERLSMRAPGAEAPLVALPDLWVETAVELPPGRARAASIAGATAARAGCEGAWRPAWSAVRRSMVHRAAETSRDSGLAPALDGVLRAACEPALRVAHAIAAKRACGEVPAVGEERAALDPVIAAAMDQLPRQRRRGSLDQALGVVIVGGVINAWEVAWVIAGRAAAVARACAVRVIDAGPAPDRWTPLLDLLRHGAAPIGVIEGRFAVYCAG